MQSAPGSGMIDAIAAWEDSVDLTFRPLTPESWPALEDLFGASGPVHRCWCMYWRIGDAYRRRPKEENKASFWEVVQRGPPPGFTRFRRRPARRLVSSYAACGGPLVRTYVATEGCE
jgi:hypothetical protein